MKHLIIFLVWLVAFSISGVAYGQNIFIWDNDASSSFISPDTQQSEGCRQAIRRALWANDYTIAYGWSLPSYLSNYDVIFIVLGFYCPG